MAVNIIGNDVAPIADNREITNVQNLYSFTTGLTNTNSVITTNDVEIDHNSLLNYVSAEHIDWSDGGTHDDLYCGSISTPGTVGCYGITLSTGAEVDNIETTVTDDDTHIPTSGAVVDYVTSQVASNATINVAKTTVTYLQEAGIYTIVSLDEGDVIWDIKVFVKDQFDSSTTNDLYIGIDGDSDYFISADGLLDDANQWKTISWTNDPSTGVPMTGNRDITTGWVAGISDFSLGEYSVYVWYSKF